MVEPLVAPPVLAPRFLLDLFFAERSADAPIVLEVEAVVRILGKPRRIIGANASIYKEFPVKERLKAQIRMDYYNPFKWFNWGAVNTTMTQTNPASFMTPGLNDFGDSTEGGPSQIHFSFRIKF